MTGNWQPIDTAPKDGTPVLLFGTRDKGRSGEPAWLTARWCKVWDGEEDWHWLEGADREDDSRILFEPTHWMPLPSAPAAK